MSATPIRDAFATVRNAPSLWLAEVAWRWAFAAAACALAFLALWTWLDSLPVSRADQFLLGSGSPALIARAVSHIFAGSATLLLRGAAVLLPGCVLLWTVAVAAGRAAILRTLMPDTHVHWRSLLAVSFLRAMVGVAAGVGVVAALIAFARISAPAPPAQGRPNAALALFFVLIVAICICWSFLNWFLGVAPIYAVRSRGLGKTLTATFVNFRENTGKWFWIGSAFGLLHLAVFFVFSAVGPLPLTIADMVPRWFTLLVLVAITLVYFALADAIQVLRLVAYLAIADTYDVDAESRTGQAVRHSPVVGSRSRNDHFFSSCKLVVSHGHAIDRYS